MEYIRRKISNAILEASKYYSVITLTGPRQVGKTTLCKNLFPDYQYYNLERVSQREIIKNDVEAFFSTNKHNMIIDEVQCLPEILPYIQVLVDEEPERKIILTGSSNFSLLHNVTQSLSGRTSSFTLLPFSLDELGDYKKTETNKILFSGMYPAIFSKGVPSDMFYRDYYNTYIERDVRQLMNIKNMQAFQLFIRLCAGRVGSECNFSALSNEVGVSAPTINEWVSILQASYILWKLPPYYANISKRLVKTPKIYFYDTGLLCYLLGIENEEQLQTFPLRGNIFENFVLSEFQKQRFNRGKESNLYFYRENKGNEVDVVSMQGTKMNLYEIKSAQTFNSAFMKGLKYVEALFPDDVASSTVIYDGAEETKSQLHGVCNFRNVFEQ